MGIEQISQHAAPGGSIHHARLGHRHRVWTQRQPAYLRVHYEGEVESLARRAYLEAVQKAGGTVHAGWTVDEILQREG